MKNRFADVKVGIFNTGIELRYGKKFATLGLPYVRWKNNNGSLAFEKRRFDRIADAGVIQKLDIMFLNYDNNPLQLRNYLQNNFGW